MRPNLLSIAYLFQSVRTMTILNKLLKQHNCDVCNDEESIRFILGLTIMSSMADDQIIKEVLEKRSQKVASTEK